MPSVTMDLTEWQLIQDQRNEALNEVAKLKADLIQAKVDSCDPHLLALSRAALNVVRYAVASLPPESNMHWPFESLRIVAENVTKMPDATADHEELAQTFKIFASEIEGHERRRKLRDLVKQSPPPGVRASSEIVAPTDQDP